MYDEHFPIDDPHHDPKPSETDLYHCYRLLLGRNPDSGGWAAWGKEVREGRLPLDMMVFNFLRSPEFQSRRKNYPELPPPVRAATVEAVAAQGFQLYVAPEDWDVGNFISQHHTWESNITEALKKRLRRGMVFLDIGANIGYFTMLAARAVGSSGEVLSFEASQTNASLIYLSARLNKFDNVHIFPFALASSRGTWMYDSFGSNGMLVPFNVECELVPGRSLVYAMTLDELLPGQKRVDVIKIDIEGAEYMALEGSRELLGRCRPVIYSEFSPVLLQHTSGKSGREYLELLRSLNYDLCVLAQTGEETFVGGDVERVLEAYEQRQGTHIDIIAVPRG